jgi:hypothetical protein
VKTRAVAAVIVAVMQGRRDARQQYGELRIAVDQRQAPTSMPSRCSRSKMKYTSPAALPVSDAAWIMLNDVMPSEKTPRNSAFEIGLACVELRHRGGDLRIFVGPSRARCGSTDAR